MRQILQRLLQPLQKFFWQLQALIKRWLRVKRKSPARRVPSTLSWVIPGKLAVGGLPQVGDGAELTRANIKVVLSLCAKLEGELPEDVTQNFRCLRYILPDRYYATEFKVDQLAQVVEIVHKSIQHQLPIYVHCLAGMERSPTVCIAYLCRYHNLELWEALNWLKQVHPRSMPNESQIRALREYSQHR